MPRRYKRACDQCGKEYEGLGAKYCSQGCADLAKLKPGLPEPTDDEWEPTVRPVRIEVPIYDLPIPIDQSFKSFHYSDSHYPFQDDRVMQIIYAIIRDTQPQIIVNHGDLADCYKLSKFQQNPNHRVGMQQEIEMCASHLATMTSLSPGARRIYLKGNHEDRLRKVIWEMNKDVPAAQLLNLPKIATALQWENLLGLQELGWEWHDKRYTLFDKLVLKHGDIVRKGSAYTARAEHDKYAKSGMSGHTHRAGSFYHRDHNGQHAWFELGCTCILDPEYIDDPDWQQSVCMVTWSEDREHWDVERILIHEGRAMFRGRLYGATPTSIAKVA